jgi:hypothetical protein
MNYSFLKVVAGLFAASIFFSSCKDECKAGAGGELNFVFTPKHHTKAIPGCIVKIKYNAKEFPGDNGPYEIAAQGLAGENTVTVSGLKCGDYYYFATGIDSSLSATDKTVKGGIPYSTDQESGTIYIDIPVTEVH